MVAVLGEIESIQSKRARYHPAGIPTITGRAIAIQCLRLAEALQGAVEHKTLCMTAQCVEMYAGIRSSALFCTVLPLGTARSQGT